MEDMANVTVFLGRTANIACTVKDLRTHQVSNENQFSRIRFESRKGKRRRKTWSTVKRVIFHHPLLTPLKFFHSFYPLSIPFLVLTITFSSPFSNYSMHNSLFFPSLSSLKQREGERERKNSIELNPTSSVFKEYLLFLLFHHRLYHNFVL